MKNWYTIKNAAEGTDVAEVSILDYIGAWGVNAQEFLREFRAIKAGTVKVYINSPGGSVFEALAMFNGMRATGKTIEVHILGVAASAASYIAMAGHKIVMPSNTYLFLHRPINAVYGNADDMRDMAEVLEKIGQGLEATYARRWKGEEAALQQFLKDETYFTAAECLEYGLCDEVTDEITAEAAFDVADLPSNLQAVFKKAAEQHPAPADPDVADLVNELVKGTGMEAYAGVFATAPTVTDRASALAAIEAAKLVKKLADMTDFSDLADGLIRKRTPVEAVRALLADAQVKRDEATFVDTAAPSTPAAAKPEFSTVALWAEIKAQKAGSKQ